MNKQMPQICMKISQIAIDDPTANSKNFCNTVCILNVW